jgi:hypothetical protein
VSAAIYLCLARIVIVYGDHLSRLRPRTYTLVFCTCDIISLLLQAAGGGIAASTDSVSLSNVGKNIMLAGLVFQVFSLILFTVLSVDFALRVYKGKGTWKTQHLDLVHSSLFKAFLVGLAIATVTILSRCVYRCVELSGGFHGTLFTSDEVVFMVMEGAMIIIACLCLTFFHPAVSFQGVWDQANFRFRSRAASLGEKPGDDRDSRRGDGSPQGNAMC